MTRFWALIQSADYREAYERVSSKYRNQISRKALELMSDPTPGGGRTALRGYDRLCRLRAGDFRIIYAYDDKVVQLMNLRRRDEHTYDNLDESEIPQFESFRAITGGKSPHPRIPDWKAIAQKWAPPKIKEVEPLPRSITAAMLDELAIPKEFKLPLLNVKSVDELLDCQDAPIEFVEKVLDVVCPKSSSTVSKLLTPVVVLGDIVDVFAAEACGPLDPSNAEKRRAAEVSALPRNDPTGNPKIRGSLEHRTTPTPLVVLSTRKSEPMRPYPGNTSRGISKDNHYTVKLDGTVQLAYSVEKDEKYLLTTDAHPDLVKMVNEAKRAGGSAQVGGRFAINEFRHVLVPATDGSVVLYAGDYTRDLEFDFNGSLISPNAPASIRPGHIWPGPHAGIKYTLAAGATDIRYENSTATGKTEKVTTKKLILLHSEEDLAGLLKMCRAVKPNGGAIYINEARELFAPVEDREGGYKRRYIGHLGKNPWFPDPV